jgi:MarR family transcriptional regulator, lower aerobic nicotinate degradation pathway regulator
VKQEPLGLLIAVVRRRIRQVTNALVREHGLSPQQFWTVVAVARGGELSLRELAERRRMDEPTACRVVDTLVRRHLLRSGPDPGDRRRLRLTLTSSARAMAEHLLPIADTIAAAVEGGLSPAERGAVVAGLEKVIANLNRFEATLSEAATPSSSGGP